VTSLRLPLSPEAIREAGLVERLKAVVGVTDAVMVAEEAAIYIKLDKELLDRDDPRAPGEQPGRLLAKPRRTLWPVGLTKSYWSALAARIPKFATCLTVTP
jgi:hypothetical protein